MLNRLLSGFDEDAAGHIFHNFKQFCFKEQFCNKPQGQSLLTKRNHEMKMEEKKMNIKGVASAINKTFSNKINFNKNKHLEVTMRESFEGVCVAGNGWHSWLPVVWIHLIYEHLCRAPLHIQSL